MILDLTYDFIKIILDKKNNLILHLYQLIITKYIVGYYINPLNFAN